MCSDRKKGHRSVNALLFGGFMGGVVSGEDRNMSGTGDFYDHAIQNHPFPDDHIFQLGGLSILPFTQSHYPPTTNQITPTERMLQYHLYTRRHCYSSLLFNYGQLRSL